MTADLLIVGGRIVDGKGAGERPGSLAIRAGRIVSASNAGGGAREVLDAGGQVVAAGSFDTVLVKGQIVYRRGELTGAFPGRSLRRGDP